MRQSTNRQHDAPACARTHARTYARTQATHLDVHELRHNRKRTKNCTGNCNIEARALSNDKSVTITTTGVIHTHPCDSDCAQAESWEGGKEGSAAPSTVAIVGDGKTVVWYSTMCTHTCTLRGLWNLIGFARTQIRTHMHALVFPMISTLPLTGGQVSKLFSDIIRVLWDSFPLHWVKALHIPQCPGPQLRRLLLTERAATGRVTLA